MTLTTNGPVPLFKRTRREKTFAYKLELKHKCLDFEHRSKL